MRPHAKRPRHGEVAEWSNVPDSKSGVRVTVPWVRIPPSPPKQTRPRWGLFCFGGESRAPARPAGWDSKGWACKPSPPESPICRPQGGRHRAPRARAAKSKTTQQQQHRLCCAVPIRGTGVSSVPRSPDCCPQGSPARRRRALQSPRLPNSNPGHVPERGRRHADTKQHRPPTHPSPYQYSKICYQFLQPDIYFSPSVTSQASDFPTLSSYSKNYSGDIHESQIHAVYAIARTILRSLRG